MTSEGELKKRILGAGYLAEDEPTFIIPESRLQQVIDEAKKDFPNLSQRLPEGFFTLEDQFNKYSEKWMKYTRILEAIVNDYWNACKKWFGDSE